MPTTLITFLFFIGILTSTVDVCSASQEITPTTCSFTLATDIIRHRVSTCAFDSSDFISYYVPNNAANNAIAAVVAKNDGSITSTFSVNTIHGSNGIDYMDTACFPGEDSNSIVTWVEPGNNNYIIYAQIFKSDGTAIANRVTVAQEPTGAIAKVAVTVINETSAAIAWSSRGTSISVKANTIDATTGQLGIATVVAIDTNPGRQYYNDPTVTVVNSAEMMICWSYTLGAGLWCRVASFDLSVIHAPFIVTQGPIPQQVPTAVEVVPLANGKSVAVYRLNQIYRTDVLATFIDNNFYPDAIAKWISMVQIRPYDYSLARVATTPLDSGNYFVVSWLAYGGTTILTQALDVNENYFGPTTSTVTSTSWFTYIGTTALDADDFAITYVNGTGSNTYDLSAQIFNLAI